MQNKKILITGGIGYLGTILIKKLLDKNYQVITVDPLIFGKSNLEELEKNKNFHLVVGLTEDIYVLKKIFEENIYAVIHLSGLSNDPTAALDYELTKKSNVDSTKNLINECKKAKVKKFIFASSCSVYGYTGEDILVNEESKLNPISAYAQSKIDCEKIILGEQDKHFCPVSFRKGTLFGYSPRMRFDLVINTMTGLAQDQNKILINGGKQWRPFLHVADAADLYCESVDYDEELISGKIFNVGNNQMNMRIIDLVDTFKSIFPGLKIEQSDNVDKRSYKVSFDKILNELNWKPKIQISDGILEIKKNLDNKKLSDFRDINYYNIKRMLSYLNIQ